MGSKFPVVTIDGPSASGKSSVSRELARHLGWNWVSTGAFYRGLALFATRKGVALDNQDLLTKLCDDQRWRVVMTAERTCVWIEDEDVTALLETEQIGAAASQVSRLSKVRESLLVPQRRCSEMGPGLVAEGRDCGTVVFPEAPFKFYLTADSEQRALRRSLQVGDDVKNTLELQKRRDDRDMNRTIAPLEIPTNAMVIDSSSMPLNQVVDSVLREIKTHLGG